MMILHDYKRNRKYAIEQLNNGKISSSELEDLIIKTRSDYKGSDRVDLYCGCCYPLQKKEIQYAVTKNAYGTYMAIPYMHNKGSAHDKSCIKNPINSEYKKKSPLYDIRPEGTGLHTMINFSKAAVKNIKVAQGRSDRSIPPQNEQRENICSSVHEFFSAYNELYVRNREQEVEATEDISSLYDSTLEGFNEKLRNYRLPVRGRMKSLSEYTLKKDGYAFVYEKVVDIDERSLGWGNDDKYFVIVETADKLNKKNKYSIPTWLYILLKKRFMAHSGGLDMEWNNKNYSLILAGSYKEDKYCRKTMLKCTFLMVGKKSGIVADSLEKASLYDDVSELFERNYAHERYSFYIPCTFLDGGIYDGQSRPDAYIEKRHGEKKCVLEIFDPNEYKKNHKKIEWLKSHTDYDYYYYSKGNSQTKCNYQWFLKKIEEYIKG